MREVWPIGGDGASDRRGTEGFRGRANRGAAEAASPAQIGNRLVEPAVGVYFPA
ncbi:hypothetical protein [Rhodanobacter panaciterrae]|uniref:hypothetical protein n=1 Tax=Rhodanobacter panaciterrae TaxID=490572 RepID=UPI001678F476|nr:hypothetical protein [Rhodanobacter panaciterrae]